MKRMGDEDRDGRASAWGVHKGCVSAMKGGGDGLVSAYCYAGCEKMLWWMLCKIIKVVNSIETTHAGVESAG